MKGLLASALGGAARAYGAVAEKQHDLNLKKQMLDAEEQMRNRLDEAAEGRRSAENDRQYTRNRTDQLADDTRQWERGAPERAQQASINERTIARADQVLASGTLEAEDKAELETLRDKAVNSTGEERFKAIEDVEIQLDKFTPRYSTGTAYVEGVDESGYPTETRRSVRTDRFTGDYESVGGSNNSGEDASDPLGIRALFGEQEMQPSPQPSQGLMAEQMEPIESVQETVEQPDLSGYQLDPEPRLGERIIDNMQASKASREQQATTRNTDQAVQEVKEILESRDLSKLSVPMAFGRLQSALQSGKLSEQEMALVRAWMDRNSQ